MRKDMKREKDKKTRQPKGGKPISIGAAIFLFGFLNAGADKAIIERGFKLALRGPELPRDMLWAWAESRGEDVERLMSGEPTTPATRAEVRELVEPALRKGAEMATLAQITDIYLFGKDRTPENIVYAFYIGTRFALVKERKPTKEESKLIWEIALWIARTSKIGAPHWKELESQGPVFLKSWLDLRKEDARKKYETFLKQKKRAEVTAENAFKTLMSDIFGDEETP